MAIKLLARILMAVELVAASMAFGDWVNNAHAGFFIFFIGAFIFNVVEGLDK